jgi:hypothetical protein
MAFPFSDDQREIAIDTYAQLAQGSRDPVLRRYWFQMMREQMADRTDKQVRKLEQQRGLSAA